MEIADFQKHNAFIWYYTRSDNQWFCG